MQRVHRKLSRDEVEHLRRELASWVPKSSARIPQLMLTLRLIARKSQIEYAKLCHVAPRVLADIEAGKGSPTVETLEKLLKPFGFRVGVVAPVVEQEGALSGSGTVMRRAEQLTVQEVAELLMVNPVTVRQWAARGLLRSVTTPRGTRRFFLSDVEEFARSRGTPVASSN